MIRSAMHKNTKELVVLLDRSGSMLTIQDQVISGFNELLSKNSGDNVFVSLFQFDDQFDEVYRGLSIKTAPRLSKSNFIPRGMTSLYDAIVRTVREMDSIPGGSQAVFVIVTDGGENSSKEYNLEQVKKAIDTLKEKKFEVMFIGANQDAILTAKTFNIPARSSLTFGANAVGTQSAFGAMAASTQSYYSNNAAVNFDEEDRKKAMGTP